MIEDGRQPAIEGVASEVPDAEGSKRTESFSPAQPMDDDAAA